MLVFALQSGDWQCEENDRGLWDCQIPDRAHAPTAPAPPTSQTAPTVAGAAAGPEPSVALPAAVAEGPSASTVSTPQTRREPGPAPADAVAGPATAPGVTAPAESASPLSRDGAAPSEGSGLDGFVVQIGAFRRERSAQRAVGELGLPQLVITPTRRGEEDWYVILLGAYPDFEAADAAGREFVDANPGAGYWVRNAAELRQSTRP